MGNARSVDVSSLDPNAIRQEGEEKLQEQFIME